MAKACYEISRQVHSLEWTGIHVGRTCSFCGDKGVLHRVAERDNGELRRWHVIGWRCTICTFFYVDNGVVVRDL